MPPSSSSRRPTAPTPRAARCGTSARSSGCRARSSSPSSTPATPTSRPPWPTARRTSAPASSRSGCRCRATQGAVTSIADLLLGEVHDYSGGTRTVRPAGPEHADVFDTYRPALIEGIIEESEDGGLMDRYLEGEELDFADPREGPAHRGRARHLPPGAPAVGRDRRRRRACCCTSSRPPSRTRACTRCRRSPRWRGGAAVEVSARPRRPAGRRGRAHPVRRLRRAPLARAGLLRHAAPRPGGARVGPPRAARRADRRGPRGPRRRRAAGRHRRPVRRRPAPQDRGDRRRGRGRHQARDGADLRHDLLPRRAAARHAVGAARGAAARRGRRRHPRRRGPDAGRVP